ncbi:MAG: hybrid sensor histidine kinase/response regulator [Pseudobdellovibrionaceae bacterium]
MSLIKIKNILKNKSKYFVLFSVVYLVFLGLTFLFLDHHYNNLAQSFIQGWANSERLEVQDGNIAQVLSRSQKFFIPSNSLTGFRADKFDATSQKSTPWLALGQLDHIDIKKINIYNQVEGSRLGVFDYVYRYAFAERPDITFTFRHHPSSAELTIYCLGLVFIIVFIVFIFVLNNENKIYTEVVRESLNSILIGKSDPIFYISNDPLMNKVLNEVYLQLQKKKSLELEKVQSEALMSLASQVSHDIRSPLSALNMLMGSLSEVSEQKRILARSAINRVTDIANNLLQKSKNPSGRHLDCALEEASSENLQLKPVLLPAIVDSLVSEKRMQWRDKSNIQIQIDLQKSYGAFANVDPTELKRVLSNMINNSLEAFDPQQKGQVEVILDSSNDQVILEIKDNGKGIPAHILAKLGEQGLTFGKEGTSSGSGLGVYHAKNTIEKWKGQFKVESTMGTGTTFKFILQKAEPPKWFVKQISFYQHQTFVVVDDDDSILQIWQHRLNPFIREYAIELITCSSPAALQEWTQNNANMISSAVFLVDYEFLGHIKNGLDLVQDLQIQQQSILVTSRYEEPAILTRCESIGVSLIPKSLAPLVPLVLLPPKKELHLCLIDDDELVRATWKMAAEYKNLDILTFASEEEFNTAADQFSTNTPIYIDVALKNNINGQDVAARLLKKGFSNLHLATGYSAEHIHKPDFIHSICGKDFPQKN